jgi:hypothetical protein
VNHGDLNNLKAACPAQMHNPSLLIKSEIFLMTADVAIILLKITKILSLVSLVNAD